MNYKSEEIKPLGMKNSLKWPLIGMKKKSHLKQSPISGKKKSHLKWPPLGGEKKKDLKWPPIRVKWPTIGNEKKMIRVTPLDVKKIHFKGLWKNNSPKWT
jgi:hypothetical protein